MHASNRNLESTEMYERTRKIIVTILDYFLLLFSLCIKNFWNATISYFYSTVGIFSCY